MVNKDNNHVEKNSEISKIQISENNIIRNNVEDKKFDEAVLKDEKQDKQQDEKLKPNENNNRKFTEIKTEDVGHFNGTINDKKMGNDAVQEDAIQTRTKENLNNQSQTNNHIKTKVTVKRATTDFENIKTVNKSETPNKNIIGTSRAYKKLTDKDIIKLRKLLAKHDLYHPVVTKSVREMTEDSSLEALDYSDNYTFQTLIFQPEPLTTKEVLDSKTIPFQIHSYLTGANSGDVYKINLQLDPIIANHVKKITVNPTGRSSLVELVRLANKEGKATNIWQVNFIRASGGLFGGAEILSQYTAENGKIELDDTVRNILEKMEDHSDKLNYLIYVKDSQENKKIKTSETSGYFLTPSETLINSIVSSNSDAANSAFKASSGAIQFDSDIGEFGGITVDQQILKNGTFNYGGPLIDSGLNKQWRYHYQIDSKLVPYIGSIELHSYDFYGVSGFDKTYYPKNKVADLAIDKDGRGSITSSNLNDLIVFNNALPETVGIRLVIKYNQSPNNILTRNAEYDENGNLISNTTKVKEDFAFYGYLTYKNGGMIKNTFGSSTYYIQDLDKDGLTDNFEFHKSHTDPFNQDTDGDRKNDGDEVLRYGTSPLVGKPIADDITTEDTTVIGKVNLDFLAPQQKVKILDENGSLISIDTLNEDGTFSMQVPKLKPGTYTIVIESPNYTNDEVNTFKVIDIKEILKPSINPVNDQSKEIEINGVEGSTIIIKDENNVIVGQTILNNGQTTSIINLKKPLKAGTILTAIAEKNGINSNVSNSVIVEDVTSPLAPTMKDFTSNDTQITGESEPNSTVEITFPDGQKVTTTTDNQGRYVVDIPTGALNNGGEVSAKATDKTGNESPKTTKDVADETVPEAPKVDNVTSNDIQIIGETEPHASVTIQFPNKQIITGKADEQGDFSIGIPSEIKLLGNEILIINITDKAGNISNRTSVSSYQ